MRGIAPGEGKGVRRDPIRRVSGIPIIQTASPIKVAVDGVLERELGDKLLPPRHIIQFKNPIVAIGFARPVAGPGPRGELSNGIASFPQRLT